MPCLKFINASRAIIDQYKNLKRKLYNYCVNIHLNQKCLRKSNLCADSIYIYLLAYIKHNGGVLSNKRHFCRPCF
jgi:hypothetical protein